MAKNVYLGVNGLKGSMKGRFEIINTSDSSYIIAKQNKSEILK